MKDDKQHLINLGVFKDQNNQTYLTVQKNGTQYLFLNRITFIPHLYNVYLKKVEIIVLMNIKIAKIINI